MDYTLYNLLKGPIIRKFTPLTRGIDYKRRVITAVSVQELPMAPYIQPGELVLTTASGAAQDPSVFDRILEEAGSVGASAVLFGFPKPLEVPEHIITGAEQLGLPLIILSKGQLFASVQKGVNQALQEARTEPYLRLQNDLFNAYFDGASLGEAADTIARFLDAEVAIAGFGDQILAATDGFRKATGIFEIRVNEDRLGELLLQSGTELSKEAGSLIRQYISYPLTLWINQIRVEKRTEARIRSDFVLRLIHSGDDPAVLQEAGQLNIP